MCSVEVTILKDENLGSVGAEKELRADEFQGGGGIMG